MNWEKIKSLIKLALEEDIGPGDITANATIPKSLEAKAFILAKEEGLICGLEVARAVFKTVDSKIIFKKLVEDGEKVRAGKKIAEIYGNARKILMAERTALNFLQRLSGIATLTAKFVKRVKPYKSKILDTRKTTPGLRILEKYAVRVGGGKNHRFGLWDGILIKGNHIDLVGLREAVKKAKKPGKKVEVEARNLKEVKEALEAGADIIMLENMDLKTIKEGVKLIGKKALIEASGGVNLDNVREIAKTGVDWISIGRLTHSVKSLDMSLRIKTN
ncbi:carboxylating nicotinate-nucleotide diphosphorylase [Patescibacteria group bacterium]|nr:carboxylating nicotinate-nucleotide diphosphorylase [Patescibacteria group bacterium]